MPHIDLLYLFGRAMAVSMEMIIGRAGSIIGNLVFPILLEYGCIAPIINLACFSLRKYSMVVNFYSRKILNKICIKYVINIAQLSN